MSAREIKISQEPVTRPVVQTNSAQLTPEYLDAIINNKNEHPHVRKQASQMKSSLFPTTERTEEPPVETYPKKNTKKKVVKKDLTEEDFLSDTPVAPPVLAQPEEEVEESTPMTNIPTPVIEPKPSPQPVNLKIRPAEANEFNNILSNFKNNLFNDEFCLLSAPGTKVQLRSMTVSEFKFLTKQFEVYQRSLATLDKDNPDITREIDIRESVLTNAIDNVLQRCITNDIKVYDLPFFDWVYILLALRAISRGTEENLRVTCTKKDCQKQIKIGILDVIKKLERDKGKFLVNPLGMLPIKENLNIYLSIPTRGDLVEAQKLFLSDPDANLGFANLSMYIRAYIQDQSVANLLEPEQRFALMNALQYDTIKEIRDIINNNMIAFYKSFGEIKCTSCGTIAEIDVSDFILFFYDF